MRHTNRILLMLAMLMPMLPASVQAAPAYANCAALTRTDPAGALTLADEWARTENTASAHHCRALALFALKRYHDAAQALDHLSTLVGQGNSMLWANILRQSGKAWELAENRANAVTALSKAIQVTAEPALRDAAFGRLTAELLLERSQLYSSGGRDLLALQDLDQGLGLAPEHTALLLARANLFIRMHETPMAIQDLQTILRTHPNHPQATELLAALR